MKWGGELFIIEEDEEVEDKVPDVFVETDSQEETYNMLVQYVVTMVGENKPCKIQIYSKW